MKQKIIDKLRKNRLKLIVALTLFALLILSFFFADNIEKTLHLKLYLSEHQTYKCEIDKSSFAVNYIDVGQGNSSYIRFPDGKVMLIDSGNIEYGQKVAKILRDDGVSKIDYLIASHADSDHIAGLNYILEEFEVKNIFRPFQIAGTGTSLETFVAYEYEDLADFYKFICSEENNRTKISRVTTDVYKNFIKHIYTEFYEEDGLYFRSNVSVFYDGLIIEGENYKIEFYAPLVRDENYDLSIYSNTKGFATVGYGTTNSNDNSGIILINIFGYKFLYTGDASWTDNLYTETKNYGYEELDFLNSLSDDEKIELKDIDVFLLGHHGSSFSSGRTLLDLINAKFFVVSVEKDSVFGHPSSDTIARITSYRKFDDYLLMTKDYGTITFGAVSGNLLFSLESFEIDNKIQISWYLLSSILFVFTIIIVFSLKTKSTGNQKH